MRKLKDIEFIESKITISIIRGRTSIERGVIEFTDKLYKVKIDKGYMRASTVFPCNNKGKKDLLKFIADECYLNKIKRRKQWNNKRMNP